MKLGLIHELVEPGPNANSEMRAKALAWIAAHPTAQHPWEAKGLQGARRPALVAAVAQMLVVAPAMIKKADARPVPHPRAIMACMVEGLQVDLDTALRLESRALAQLMTGTNAKAVINTFFFNMNAIKGGHSRPRTCRATSPPRWACWARA